MARAFNWKRVSEMSTRRHDFERIGHELLPDGAKDIKCAFMFCRKCGEKFPVHGRWELNQILDGKQPKLCSGCKILLDLCCNRQ